MLKLALSTQLGDRAGLELRACYTQPVCCVSTAGSESFWLLLPPAPKHDVLAPYFADFDAYAVLCAALCETHGNAMRCTVAALLNILRAAVRLRCCRSTKFKLSPLSTAFHLKSGLCFELLRLLFGSITTCCSFSLTETAGGHGPSSNNCCNF